MIKREEIERLIASQGLQDTVDYVWSINCAAVPELTADGEEGEDCRFGLAEHIVHKFFDTKAAKNLPNGAFAMFCERFHASEQDIATALEQTRQDLKADEVPESDVATTMVWLWFIDAAREHGIYDAELKFFLHTVTDMSRGDAELKRKGLENLVKSVEAKPSLLFRLLACMGRKAH